MARPGNSGFSIENWRVSPAEGVLTCAGETTRLEPKAMEVLVYLASHPGEVITREELEREVWRGAVVGYDAVTNTVIKLRKALQDDARQPRFIATIPKKGYQLIAPITGVDDDESPAPAPVPKDIPAAKTVTPRLQLRWFGLGGVALLGALVLWLAWTWSPDPSPVIDAPAVLPSIIVLPFENLGDDPKQEYLADGITEDIITDLSRLSSLLVIASNTSTSYRGKQVTPEQVGADLGVAFVLKGSIRRLGDTLRVNTQLVNAKTGFNVWAQRYDRKVTEVFAVQDEVTRSIVEALAIKMTNQEKLNLAKKATASLEAYDFFQEGQRTFKINTKEANEQASEIYRKAIALDPNYGRAYGALAIINVANFRNGWTDSPVETMDRALLLAKKAVTLDSSSPQTYWALGFVYLFSKEYENAEKTLEQAVKIAPNYADGYSLLALIKGYVGQPERAIELNDKAIRLNPYYSFEYLISYGVAYYTLHDYDAAIAVLERAEARNENAVQIKLFLATNYIRAGRIDDAEWIVDQLQVNSPGTTILNTEKTFPIANADFKRNFLNDLRKAGLPE